MLKVRNPAVAPPGGWRFTDPETRQEFRDGGLKEITQQVEAFLKANRRPTESLQELIIHQTASWLVDHGHEAHVVGEKAVRRGFVEYWRGTKAFAAIREASLKGEPVFVSQGLAEKRAAVCNQCAMNVVATNRGAAFAAADAAMASQVDGHATSLDAGLGHCDACSCRCRVIVWLTKGLLGTADSGNLPLNCWKISEPK